MASEKQQSLNLQAYNGAVFDPNQSYTIPAPSTSANPTWNPGLQQYQTYLQTHPPFEDLQRAAMDIERGVLLDVISDLRKEVEHLRRYKILAELDEIAKNLER